MLAPVAAQERVVVLDSGKVIDQDTFDGEVSRAEYIRRFAMRLVRAIEARVATTRDGDYGALAAMLKESPHAACLACLPRTSMSAQARFVMQVHDRVRVELDRVRAATDARRTASSCDASTEDFLGSTGVTLCAGAFCPFTDFKAALREFEQSKGYAPPRYTTDFFRPAFAKHGIAVVRACREYGGRKLTREYLDGADLVRASLQGSINK